MRRINRLTAGWIGLCLATTVRSLAADVTVQISSPMQPAAWAVLERRLLAAHLPACREFFNRYFDQRGYLQCVVRWGANDGPDDAFEKFNGWPELHALGASDEILSMYLAGWEGLLRQYTAAKTVENGASRDSPGPPSVPSIRLSVRSGPWPTNKRPAGAWAH